MASMWDDYAKLVGRITRDCAEGNPTPYVLGIREVDVHTWAQPSYAPYFATQFGPPEARALRRVRGRVLDAGCGPGRHMLHLQSQNIPVVGIELSPEVCAIARQRGCNDVRQMSFCEPALDGEEFDTLLFLGDTLGFAVTQGLEPYGVLRKLWRFVRPGGLLLGHVARTRIDTDPGMWHTGVQFLFLEYNGEEASVPFMIFSVQEWRDVLYCAGFNLVDSWGDGAHGAYLVAERMDEIPPEQQAEVAEDIFGEVILAHYERRSSVHALNVDGWKWWYRDASEWFDPNLPPGEVEALSHARGRVLDIGCGVGRHLQHCQGLGLEAVGIDISPLTVEVAKAHGVDAQVGDVFDLPFDKASFDTVLLMGNNIGMAGGADSARRILRIARDMVPPGGVLICGFVPGPPVPPDDEGLQWLESNLRIEFKDKVGSWFPWAVFHPDTLQKLCQQNGWQIVKLIQGDELHMYLVARAA